MSKVIKACIIMFLWISVTGTLLHFTYDWSGGNSFVGLFSAVNESIWEHMKLLFFPCAVFSIAAYPHFRKEYPAFLTCAAFAAVGAMVFQTAAYYTYSGILGKNIDAVNIAIFFIGAAVCSFLLYAFLKRNPDTGSLWGLAVFCLVSVCFFCFTKEPPALGIFTVPDISCIT